MNDKYYTPQIEEFHPGFEYEQLNTEGWEKYIYGEKEPEMGWMLPSTRNMFTGESKLLSDKIRVKYLDKQDFKELNINLSAEGVSGGNPNIKENLIFNNFILFCSTRQECCMMYNIISKRLIITIANEINGSAVFCGIIKNKSELIKLLKQLQIEIN